MFWCHTDTKTVTTTPKNTLRAVHTRVVSFYSTMRALHHLLPLLLTITIFHASSTLAPLGMVLRRPSTIRNLQLFIPCKLFTSEHTTNNNQTISARSVSRRVFDHILRNMIYCHTKGQELNQDMYWDIDDHLLMLEMNDTF